jgi:hypothetical protein
MSWVMGCWRCWGGAATTTIRCLPVSSCIEYGMESEMGDRGVALALLSMYIILPGNDRECFVGKDGSSFASFSKSRS